MSDRAREAYHADSAIIGMWLFIATETLFFGALFFAYLVCRHLYPQAMALGAGRTELTIGTINAALLLTSSLAMAWATKCAARGAVRGLIGGQIVAALLGAGFLLLKGIEYAHDFRRGLFPGPGFVAAPGDPAPQQLFFVWYFIATAIHALHMAIGLGLIAMVVRRAMQGRYSAANWTPVAVVALYWSFVDMVWICLYPLLYLVGRNGA